ncbi:hypothetical protein AVEN_242153-1 [Araneus ventricosus]|uniref:Uncharacterized protein n=1 Tax=Araneus ventricosus TaxID=182803 RepID=A0A4Y2DGF6_ARAVE|nr:hypothetical protein AVEN_242153-1 [Araneus ventricosus]
MCLDSENSPTREVMGNYALFSNIPENKNTCHRKNTALAQISNTNRQQFAKLVQQQHFEYRLASNSLLALTADKTPKRDSKGVRTPKAIPVDNYVQSRSTHSLYCSVIRTRSFYSLSNRL